MNTQHIITKEDQRRITVRLCAYQLHSFLISIDACTDLSSQWIDQALMYLQNKEVLNHIWKDGMDLQAPDVQYINPDFNYLTHEYTGVLEYLMGADMGWDEEDKNRLLGVVKLVSYSSLGLGKYKLARAIAHGFDIKAIKQDELKYIPSAIRFQNELDKRKIHAYFDPDRDPAAKGLKPSGIPTADLIRFIRLIFTKSCSQENEDWLKMFITNWCEYYRLPKETVCTIIHDILQTTNAWTPVGLLK